MCSRGFFSKEYIEERAINIANYIIELPTKEYRELLGSVVCVFNSNNSFIIKNTITQKSNEVIAVLIYVKNGKGTLTHCVSEEDEYLLWLPQKSAIKELLKHHDEETEQYMINYLVSHNSQDEYWDLLNSYWD